MIIALLSDIHGNLEAFEACLKHAGRLGVTRYAFLGDLVGYGADPELVVATVMKHTDQGAIAVRGNHDDAVEQSSAYMNDSARDSIAWTRTALSAERKAFLTALPLVAHEGSMCFVHASAAAPARWNYVDSVSAAQRSAEAAGATYTFSGHVHEQALYFELAKARWSAFVPTPGKPIPVRSHRRWLALVGSVGQPRDGIASAAYSVFDTEREVLTFHRVAYDNLAAARKIRQTGLPESHAYRVERGI